MGVTAHAEASHVAHDDAMVQPGVNMPIGVDASPPLPLGEVGCVVYAW